MLTEPERDGKMIYPTKGTSPVRYQEAQNPASSKRLTDTMPNGDSMYARNGSQNSGFG